VPVGSVVDGFVMSFRPGVIDPSVSNQDTSP